MGYEVKTTSMKDEYDIDPKLPNISGRMPSFSRVLKRSVPWSFKKYMDQVYSFGMDGRLCNGDGRSRKDPSIQYGQGGTLT